MARPTGSSSSALRNRWSTLSSGSPRLRSRRCCFARWRQHEDRTRASRLHPGWHRRPRSRARRRDCRRLRDGGPYSCRKRVHSEATPLDSILEAVVVGNRTRCRVRHALVPGGPRSAHHSFGSRSQARCYRSLSHKRRGREMTMISGSAVRRWPPMLLADLSGSDCSVRLQALDAAVVGDADVFHDLARLDLADARERSTSKRPSVCRQCTGGGGPPGRNRTILQLVLQFSASSAGLGGLCQSSRTLFGRELRRCCHSKTLVLTTHSCATFAQWAPPTSSATVSTPCP